MYYSKNKILCQENLKSFLFPEAIHNSVPSEIYAQKAFLSKNLIKIDYGAVREVSKPRREPLHSAKLNHRFFKLKISYSFFAYLAYSGRDDKTSNFP